MHALHALGLQTTDRDAVVAQIFKRRRRDAVEYWLQMMLSVGIATLGLVLGSTAVVIGAMLISPLMGPIVELGIGLVVGSPLLTIRSFIRMMGSIAAAVAGAAVLTLFLPFHEINNEISSRTFPTVLDLLIATFVALAAALTTVKSTSETASAAAGAAIGIALVPPLGVIGFGLGTRDLGIARGASLLFTANMSAILLVAVLSFLVLGFDAVDTDNWEREALAETRANQTTRRVVELLRRMFGYRYSRILRVLIPGTLLAAVFVPLSQALDEVAWEVRARTAVSRVIAQTPVARSAVQSVATVQGGTINLLMHVVASPEGAAELEDRLRTQIAAATGTVPTIRVNAVPDLDALRQATSQPDVVPPLASAAEISQSLDGALRAVWPTNQIGPLLSWRLRMQDTTAMGLEVSYLGEDAGPAAEALLSRTLSERVNTPVRVSIRAHPHQPIVAAPSRGAEWLPNYIRAMDAARETKGVYACIEVPASASSNAALTSVATAVQNEVSRLPPERVLLQQGDLWSIRLSPMPCVPPTADGAT